MSKDSFVIKQNDDWWEYEERYKMKRKTRAVIMGTSCFPFLIRYWRELFNKWEKTVDKVYISLAPLGDYPGAREYAKSVLKHPKIRIRDKNEGWPTGMEEDAKEAKEDLLLVLHDDTFIHKPEFLEDTFSIMGDKAITPIHQVYSEIGYVEENMKKRYGDMLPWKCASGEQGYSFLLYLLFIPREQLMETSVNFQGSGWKKGDYIKELGITTDRDFGGDTGFKLGLELLQNGVMVQPIPRYTTANIPLEKNPLEKLRELQKNKEDLFSDEAGWLHICGMGNRLGDWFDKNKKEYKQSEQFKQDCILKLGWLFEFLSCDEFNEVSDYKEQVNREVENVIKKLNIDFRRVKEYQKIFHQLLWGK